MILNEYSEFLILNQSITCSTMGDRSFRPTITGTTECNSKMKNRRVMAWTLENKMAKLAAPELKKIKMLFLLNTDCIQNR